MTYPIPAEGRNPTPGQAQVQNGDLGVYLWDNRTYNVRDYGAKGDGATPDTTAFQNAINAAAARNQGGQQGGGTVYVPPGLYAISGITLSDGVQLLGADRWRTVLLQTATPAPQPMITVAAPTQLQIIRNLCLDGSHANQINSGIYLDGSGSTPTFADMMVLIDCVTILNTKGNGIETSSGGWVRDIHVHQCRIHNCDGHGISFKGTDSKFEHVSIGAAGNCGLYLQGNEQVVVGCTAFGSGRVLAGNGQGFGFLSDTGLQHSYIGCIAQQNAGGGFGATGNGQNFTWHGCNADSNNKAGFQLFGIDGFALIGNLVTDTPGLSPAHVNGMLIQTTSKGSLVGNVIKAGSTARPIIDDPANAQVHAAMNVLDTQTASEQTRVRSLSSTTIQAKNLRGTVTVTGISPTGTATFPAAEPDANYFLSLVPVSSTGGPALGSNRVVSVVKAPGSFTLTVEVAPGTGKSVTFDWHLIR
jgi:hypothetical protein